MEHTIFQIRLSNEHNRQQTGFANMPNYYPEKRRESLRKYARIKATKRILKYAAITACILLLAWIVLSWIDIISHNTAHAPIYQPWNIFPIIF